LIISWKGDQSLAVSWEEYQNIEGVITYPNGGYEKSYSIQIANAYWQGSEAKFIIINDISTVKNYYKNLNANKDQLLATVSHELRTPLNCIIGMIGLALEESLAPGVREKLEIVLTSGRLLLNMINDILDLSLLDKGKLKLYPETTNLIKVVEETVTLLKFQANAKGIELHIQNLVDDERKIYTKTDGNRLRQVLINLIGNAIKFTIKGSVSIRLSERDIELGSYQMIKKTKSQASSLVSFDGKFNIESHVDLKGPRREILFEVIDTGIGIKKKDLRSLFKLFGKLDQDDQGINRQGVGLGLAVSQSLIRCLNNFSSSGEIRVESEYGKGSRFYFPLPIFFDEKKESLNERELTSMKFPLHFKAKSLNLRGKKSYNLLNNEETETDKEADLKNKSNINILIVDDDQINLIVISNYLKSSREFNFSFQTAFNGNMAIELAYKNHLNSNPFDVILMDCNMPIMDGFQATKILKNKMWTGDITSAPIIAITASVTYADVERCLKTGMDAYLSKPFKKTELIDKIKEVLI
jgi:signal transduction histidine kinase